VLLLLFCGEVLPSTFFKLTGVVKLRSQSGVVSRETLKCGQKWTSKDLHASELPFEGVKQRLNPGFFLAGFYLPHTPLRARPGAIRTRVKKHVPGYQVSVDLPVLWWKPLYSYSVQGLPQGLESKALSQERNFRNYSPSWRF
jgi:hypothetical protein